MKKVTCPQDIPEGEHFLLIVFNVRSFHVPGDKRSREYPGHGYPEHDERIPSPEIHVTTRQDEVIDMLRKLHDRGELSKAVVLQVKGKLTTRVNIGIDLVDHS